MSDSSNHKREPSPNRIVPAPSTYVGSFEVDCSSWDAEPGEVPRASQLLKSAATHAGSFELEFIVENKTEEVFLIEMNPRFPAWVYLATAAGINLPAMHVQLALGAPVEPRTDYDVGKVFIRHARDEIIPMAQLESLSTSGMVAHATQTRLPLKTMPAQRASVFAQG